MLYYSIPEQAALGAYTLKVPEWLGVAIVLISWTTLAGGLTNGNCQNPGKCSPRYEYHALAVLMDRTVLKLVWDAYHCGFLTALRCHIKYATLCL